MIENQNNISSFSEYSKNDWVDFLKKGAYRGLKVNKIAKKLDRSTSCIYNGEDKLELTIVKGDKAKEIILDMSKLRGKISRFTLSRLIHNIRMCFTRSNYTKDFNARIDKLAEEIMKAAEITKAVDIVKCTECIESEETAEDILQVEETTEDILQAEEIAKVEEFIKAEERMIAEGVMKRKESKTAEDILQAEEIAKVEEFIKAEERAKARVIKNKSPAAKLNRFYEKYQIEEKKSFIFSSDCLTAQEIIDEFLNKNQGFCIGEEHSHKAPKDFLIDNMQLLNEKGVKVLFMEQFYDQLQSDLDDFALTGDVSQNLKNNINNARHSYGYKEVVMAARAAGIRVVGIDSKSANIDDNKNRNRVMNYIAFKIMKKEISKLKDNEKYVILTGSNHMSMVHEGVPGLAEILKCPRWVISDQVYCKYPLNMINSDTCSLFMSANHFNNVDTDALTVL